MATFNSLQDDLVKCPYNPFHKVKRGRLNIHMTKCRKEHPRYRLKPCPFTTDHMAPANDEDYQRHLATCPDRSSTFCTATRDDPDPPFDIPAPGGAKPFVPEPEEQWDVGPSSSGRPVDPFQPAVPPIFRTVQGMKPAERRRHYQSLNASGPPVVYVPGQYPQMEVAPMPRYYVPGLENRYRASEQGERVRNLADVLLDDEPGAVQPPTMQAIQTRAVQVTQPQTVQARQHRAAQFWAPQVLDNPPAPGSTVDMDALARRMMGLGRARPQPENY
ncbi:hypothetical protein HPB49_021743 [Dermacentor silvarum]|uniref:Uncharacterized protein n=1 Tax=Dermacentor silvarum TaxID=543639 RepID=A0ACB8CBH4_DERSI|nr:uncharacterized protein LOC119462518 [Dermacentor silvarum]KAH7938209.1 hypothetical protein HPB49_021743 [Dermacentor silvarum]